MMADVTKEPAVRIPAAYRKYRRLVGIPETEYQRLVLPHQTRTVDRAKENAAWEAVRGIWADRDDLDPVAYQRAIRDEWEERLTRQRRLASPRSRRTRHTKRA